MDWGAPLASILEVRLSILLRGKTLHEIFILFKALWEEELVVLKDMGFIKKKVN